MRIFHRGGVRHNGASGLHALQREMPSSRMHIISAGYAVYSGVMELAPYSRTSRI